MFHWFRQRPLRRAGRAVEQGRTAIEAVIGLPHVLARPLVERHFGTLAAPSDEAFRETGRNGYWQLPAPHPEFVLHVAAGDDGRLTEGLIRGDGPWAGLCVYTLWRPDDPAPVWQIQLASPVGEQAPALYEYLVGEPPPVQE